MIKEIIYTNIQLDELALGREVFKKAREFSSNNLSVSTPQKQSEITPKQPNTGSLNLGGITPSKEERNLSNSYKLILQSLEQKINNLNLGLKGQDDKNFKNDLKALFVNTQTISPQIYVSLKEYKTTQRTTINIDVSGLAKKYNLDEQLTKLLFDKIKVFINDLNSLKSTIKFKFVEPPKIANKDVSTPPTSSVPQTTTAPTTAASPASPAPKTTTAPGAESKVQSWNALYDRWKPKQGTIPVSIVASQPLQLVLKNAGANAEQQREFAVELINNIIIPHFISYLNKAGINVSNPLSKQKYNSENPAKDEEGKTKEINLFEASNKKSSLPKPKKSSVSTPKSSRTKSQKPSVARVEQLTKIPLFTGGDSLLQKILEFTKQKLKVQITPEIENQFKDVIKILINHLKINNLETEEIKENFNLSKNFLSEQTINRWKVLAEIKK